MKVERRNFSNIKLYNPVELGVMTKSAANVWEVVFESSSCYREKHYFLLGNSFRSN